MQESGRIHLFQACASWPFTEILRRNLFLQHQQYFSQDVFYGRCAQHVRSESSSILIRESEMFSGHWAPPLPSCWHVFLSFCIVAARRQEPKARLVGAGSKEQGRMALSGMPKPCRSPLPFFTNHLCSHASMITKIATSAWVGYCCCFSSFSSWRGLVASSVKRKQVPCETEMAPCWHLQFLLSMSFILLIPALCYPVDCCVQISGFCK